MKEATGELNMTVITVVAIAAVAAFFYLIVWPNIKVSVANNQCEATCGKDNFAKATMANFGSGTATGGASVTGGWECTCSN